jgi:hypothetical protein
MATLLELGRKGFHTRRSPAMRRYSLFSGADSRCFQSAITFTVGDSSSAIVLTRKLWPSLAWRAVQGGEERLRGSDLDFVPALDDRHGIDPVREIDVVWSPRCGAHYR